METAFPKTPLGIAKIGGGDPGSSSVAVLGSDKTADSTCPGVLEDAVYRLQEYFHGKRSAFGLRPNPRGTDFKKGYGPSGRVAVTGRHLA